MKGSGQEVLQALIDLLGKDGWDHKKHLLYLLAKLRTFQFFLGGERSEFPKRAKDFLPLQSLRQSVCQNWQQAGIKVVGANNYSPFLRYGWFIP